MLNSPRRLLGNGAGLLELAGSGTSNFVIPALMQLVEEKKKTVRYSRAAELGLMRLSLLTKVYPPAGVQWRVIF